MPVVRAPADRAAGACLLPDGAAQQERHAVGGEPQTVGDDRDLLFPLLERDRSVHDAPYLLERAYPAVGSRGVAPIQRLAKLEPQQRHLSSHHPGNLLLAPLHRDIGRILARREHRHPRTQRMAARQFARAEHGLGAGAVGVEHEGDVAGEAHHQADLAHR